MLKLYNDTDIQNIADAIRTKNGSESLYKVSEMSAAISAINPEAQVTEYDNLILDGNNYIEIPTKLKTAYSYFIDFTTETQADATGEHVIFGIKNDYYVNFVGIRYYQLRYQVGTNGGSTNVVNSWEELVGHHTFFYDGLGGVSFDNGAQTYTYNASAGAGDDISFVIGSATATPRTGATWKGKIHRFTVRDTANDNALVADYVPAAYVSGNNILISGLYDKVGGGFYPTPICQVSNDNE